MTQAWIAEREIQSRSWKNHDLSLEGIAALGHHIEMKSVQRTEACIASSSFHPCKLLRLPHTELIRLPLRLMRITWKQSGGCNFETLNGPLGVAGKCS